MLLSQILSKPIISLLDASYIGTINGAITNSAQNKILGFSTFDKEENEGFISYKNMFSVEDVVIIKNTSKVQNVNHEMFKILGLDSYSTSGSHLGKIIDVELGDKGEILKYITEHTTFLPSQLFNINIVVIVCLDKNINLKSCRTFAFSHSNTPQVVKALEEKTLPSRLMANTSLLIGRKMTANVLGSHLEIIAKQGQTINDKILQLAYLQGKTQLLFYNSI